MSSPDELFGQWLTWLLASVNDSGGALSNMTSSMAGCLMPSIWEAWSVIGNKNVAVSSTWTVKALVSTPLAFQSASAFSLPSGMAGKTTAISPTMFWQSGEPGTSTHLLRRPVVRS